MQYLIWTIAVVIFGILLISVFSHFLQLYREKNIKKGFTFSVRSCAKENWDKHKQQPLPAR